MRILAALVLLAGCGITSGKTAPPGKLNIILIMADDLGYETIGANGGESYKTPVLDRMAEEGVRFRHCYSQPLCTPSRVKLMTGVSNVRNYIRFGILDPKATTFGHLFKKAGYATAVVGKWQLGKQKDIAQHFGFDESCLWQHTRGRTAKGSKNDTRFSNPRLEINGAAKDYNDGEFGPDVVSDYACDFMERNKEKPFLLYYPMILTHCPFIPTPGTPDYDPKSMGSPTYKGDAKYFGDMVHHMDKIVGKLWDKVKALGLEENTLILFTGDNGTDTPVVSKLDGRDVAGAKGAMTDAGNRVPLIVYGKGKIAKGLVTDTLVDFSDFLPTICEAAGIEVPAGLDGQSFLPQLKGEEGSPRKWIYMWYSRSGNNKQAKSFTRTQRYKLYKDGRFIDVKNDPGEKKPLTELTSEAEAAKKMLAEALARYDDARPAHLGKGKK